MYIIFMPKGKTMLIDFIKMKQLVYEMSNISNNSYFVTSQSNLASTPSCCKQTFTTTGA